MRFRPGDIVIKNTGGNKMRIVEYTNDETVNCMWATESINDALFDESDLLHINEYKSVIKSEKRDDIISEILKTR